MTNPDQILLHDYFDNLLSPEAQKEFEETLLDKIDLAIDLGKLKNLQRNLHNLSSNFEPNEIVIENIIASLLEDKVKIDSPEIEVEKEDTKRKKKKIKKERKGLKALTKFRLKRLFTFFAFLSFIALIAAGYLYFQKENSSFPWEVSLISENSSSELQSIVSSGLGSNAHLTIGKDESVKITIVNNGIFELHGESEIEIISGTQLQNSIIIENGNLEFTPQIGNISFQLIHNEIILQSKNSQFEITASNTSTSKVKVLTNFVDINLKNVVSKIPFNHTIQYLDKNHISLPLISNASKQLTKLVHEFDIKQSNKTILSILKLSTKKNVFTLFFMLSKVTPTHRELVIEKLQHFYPLPKSITILDILMLNNDALETWWEEIYSSL